MEGAGRDRGTAAGARGATYVRASGLTKAYGAFTAVADIALEVAEGETLALLGPSGCGKTTILRCIAGLLTPEAGTIEIGGGLVFDAARGVNLMPERRELGVVFQSYAVWPHMTVAENVGFPLKVRGMSRRRAAERVDEILELVGLRAWRDNSATALSGGQQQRVALARALVHRPRLVLFDEPMSNLDAQLREQMRVELKLLQQRLGFTSIYVTHDQAEAFALARRIAVMNRGRIEAEGTPREVFGRPATPFVARFFGWNVLEGRVLALAGAGPAWAVQVALPGGVALWGVLGTDAPVAAGEGVALCVRREHVRIAPAAAEGAGADHTDQALRGKIRASSFQGLHDEHLVEFGGVELRAVQPSCGIEGGEATILLDRRDCIVLPAG